MTPTINDLYIKEGSYTKVQIMKRLGLRGAVGDKMFQQLRTKGIIKLVKQEASEADFNEVATEIDDGLEDISGGGSSYFFSFVGIILISGKVLKCYPKYITRDKPLTELKQVLKVIQRYNYKNQNCQLYNDELESKQNEPLNIMLTLLNDYYENGLYENDKDIIENNGNGEIHWDKTINDSFTLLSNNRPYYLELKTKKRIYDETSYIKRLHAAILTQCSEELTRAEIMELFELLPVEMSDELVEDFGDTDYILYRLEQEQAIQFNTRKNQLLKLMHAYISNRKGAISETDFEMFGTTSYELVWEQVCAQVLNNQLDQPMYKLPIIHNKGNKHLIDLIEKPKWVGLDALGNQEKPICTKATLIPDIITIYKKEGQTSFLIFDAKYYLITLGRGKLAGNPGIESVTKQYLYELAYKKFLMDNQIKIVKNCFVFPMEDDSIMVRNIGFVEMDMFAYLGLAKIQLLKMSASRLYDYYLHNKKLDLSKLLICED